MASIDFLGYDSKFFLSSGAADCQAVSRAVHAINMRRPRFQIGARPSYSAFSVIV